MQKQESVSLFKEVMGNYPTGVTVITTNGQTGTPVGLTVNSFASLSLEPMLVLWSVDFKRSTFEDFEEADGFAIHIIADDQSELCKDFATSGLDNFSRFERHDWETSEHNLPILKGCFGVLECKTYLRQETGDHLLLVGEVQNLQINHGKSPMLYHNRQLGSVPVKL